MERGTKRRGAFFAQREQVVGVEGELWRTENIREFANQVKRRAGLGMDLVLSKRYQDALPDQAQEDLVLELISDSAIALSTIRRGGTFLLEVSYLDTLLSAQLIQILADAFSSITLVKPVMTAPDRPLRYLVCQDYRGIPEMAEQLLRANDALQRGETITSLFPEENLDPRLVEYVLTRNQEHYSTLVSERRKLLQAPDNERDYYHSSRYQALFHLS